MAWKKPIPAKDEPEFIRMANEGKAVSIIAERFGISKQCVSRMKWRFQRAGRLKPSIVTENNKMRDEGRLLSPCKTVLKMQTVILAYLSAGREGYKYDVEYLRSRAHRAREFTDDMFDEAMRDLKVAGRVIEQSDGFVAPT